MLPLRENYGKEGSRGFEDCLMQQFLECDTQIISTKGQYQWRVRVKHNLWSTEVWKTFVKLC